LAAVTGLLAVAIALLMIGGAGANPVTGAVNTTDDPAWNGPNNDGLDLSGNAILGAPTQACLNGGAHVTPAVNCNIYLSKTDVFLSGSPSPATPGAGTYFFAVLVPGGQPDPNDDGAKNLSDQNCLPYGLLTTPVCPGGNNADGSPIPSGDPVTNREFSIDGSGNISPLGGSTHAFDATYQEIQVAPYDDTTNNGGVYILATCKISDSGAFVASVGTVDPRDCKYDAFKVQQAPCPDCGGKPPAAELSISKDATPALDREFAWSITKGADKTKVDLDGSGTATFNYTVKVTHDPGTLTNWKVTGTINILNFNDFAVPNVTVSDDISDDANDTCSITDGVNTGDPLGGQTVPAFVDPNPGLLSLSYTCTWAPGAGPAANMEHNTARVDWPDTTGSADTADLPAGHADFTLPFTFGTPNPIDNCADVSDTFNGGTPDGLAHVCANNSPLPSSVNPHNLANFALAYLANTQADGTTSAGYGTFKFTYSRSIPFSAGTLGSCLDYSNRASSTDNSTPAITVNADKTVTVCFFGPRFTPGYWKNHLADAVSGHTYSDSYCGTTALKNAGGSCSTIGPFAKQWTNSTHYKCLGGPDNCTPTGTSPYKVDSILNAAKVFSAMSCSFSGNAANQNQQAIGCLAGHLLSAKYNRNINGSDPCIDATISAADAFLLSIPYTGPTGTYTGISAAQRSTAIALKTSLDNYDNGGGCHT
jgi:hypothetical protein